MYLPRNKLVWPGGRAEINRAHPAYTPHLRYAGVPLGNNFVNLVNAKTATVSGSPAAQISPLQGSGVYFPSGAGLTAPGIIDTPAIGVTMAAIVTPLDNSVSFGGVFYTGNGASASNDYGLTVSGGVFKLYNHGNVQTLTGFPSYTVGRPYFVAMCEVATASGTLPCWWGVMVDLSNGEVWIGNTTGTNSITTPTAATFYVGGQGASHASLALVSAVMYSADPMTLNDMLGWAADPWSFWYPRRAKTIIGMGLSRGASPAPRSSSAAFLIGL